MSEIKIDGQVIQYMTKKEVNASGDEHLNALYDFIEDISNRLQINTPYLAIAVNIITGSLTDGVTINSGMSFMPEDIPELDNAIIMISPYGLQARYVSGVILHEIRHVWQRKYAPDIYGTPANGLKESLDHPAEIDADAYAIAVIAIETDTSVEENAALLCEYEYEHHKDAFDQRVLAAKELIKEMAEPEVESKGKKESAGILKKIVSILKRG